MSRISFAGSPPHNFPEGILVLGLTIEPAATIDHSPTSHSSMTTDPMPINELSDIEQPCNVTECPTVTLLPIIVGYLLEVTCTTLLS